MSRKKWLMLGSTVGISGIVMVTTGLSAMAGASGYDAYKSALKNTKTVQSVSVQAEASLTDNGNTLAGANGSMKADLKNRLMSGTAQVTGTGADQSFNVYKQTDGTVLKTNGSDVYYVESEGKDGREKDSEQEQEDPVMTQQMETVIDALVGNLKDYVTLDTQTDGSKTVSVSLSQAQIPAVVNALAPIVIKQATSEHKDWKQSEANAQEQFPLDKSLITSELPKLTQDISIQAVTVNAHINADNFIDHQQADLTVSGKDANGAAHVVTVHFNADLSGFNNTTPEQVDLTGKTVQQIKHAVEGRHKRND